MLRVVIDTSSLVIYVLTRGEIMRQVVPHWRDSDFRLLSSPATPAELAAVLQRPRIRRLAVTPVDELALGVGGFSRHVPGNQDLAVPCPDPKDAKFLLCVDEGEVRYLVSSDRDLLDIRRWRGVAIVNPDQFLLALELYGMEPVAMAGRFELAVLRRIQETVVLDPGTAERVKEAVELSGEG